MRWAYHVFEAQGGDGASGVHEEIDRIERATEAGDPDALKAFDGRADEEDHRRPPTRMTKYRRMRQSDPKQQDERERKHQVDLVARDEPATWAGIMVRIVRVLRVTVDDHASRFREDEAPYSHSGGHVTAC